MMAAAGAVVQHYASWQPMGEGYPGDFNGKMWGCPKGIPPVTIHEEGDGERKSHHPCDGISPWKSTIQR